MVVRGTGRLIVRHADDHHKVKWVLFRVCVFVCEPIELTLVADCCDRVIFVHAQTHTNETKPISL